MATNNIRLNDTVKMIRPNTIEAASEVTYAQSTLFRRYQYSPLLVRLTIVAMFGLVSVMVSMRGDTLRSDCEPI